MPSSKCAAPGGPDVLLAADGRGDDRSARKPRALQLRQRRPAGDQAADAGRPAEHLVEGEGDEVGLAAAQVQPVGRYEGGRVEQHVPAERMRALDPLQRMLDAGEVGLRGIREQVVVVPARGGEVAREDALVDPQVGGDARHVGDLRAAGTNELADAVDRVVVVDRQQEAVAGVERVGLADQAQRAGRVGREDRDVLVRRRAEEGEHGRPGLLGERRARRRGRVDRVRVPEHAALEQPEVLTQLGVGVQAAARVVEVDVPGRVEAPVVGLPQRVEQVEGLHAAILRSTTRGLSSSWYGFASAGYGCVSGPCRRRRRARAR